MPNPGYSRLHKHIVLKVAILKIDIKLIFSNHNANLVKFSFDALI